MSERLRQMVLQNAETSRLLGVGYVPMYRVGQAETTVQDEEPAQVGIEAQPPAAAPVPAPVVAPKVRPAPPAPPVIAEPKAAVRTRPQPPPAATSSAAPSGRLPAWLPTCSGVVAAARGKEEAQAALDALRARYEADAPHKQFKTDHHSIVWGEGDPRARLMFVGEAPGEEEDIAGRPFVGRSGHLLDKMINAMGLSRQSVYIANVLKTRPPENATPTSLEAQLCAPYLFEQIAIVSPVAVVTLGLPATRLLLSTDAAMGQLRGRWATFTLPDGRQIPVMPTYHPAYVLRSYTEEVRGKVWADLQLAMAKLNAAGEES